MTKLQKRLLDFIRGQLEATGVAPSFEEMREALGLKGKGQVHALILRLEERGKITRLPRQARGIALAGTDLSQVSTSELMAELQSRGWKRFA